jgi:hypothetical protein
MPDLLGHKRCLYTGYFKSLCLNRYKVKHLNSCECGWVSPDSETCSSKTALCRAREGLARLPGARNTQRTNTGAQTGLTVRWERDLLPSASGSAPGASTGLQLAAEHQFSMWRGVQERQANMLVQPAYASSSGSSLVPVLKAKASTRCKPPAKAPQRDKSEDLHHPSGDECCRRRSWV